MKQKKAGRSNQHRPAKTAHQGRSKLTPYPDPTIHISSGETPSTRLQIHNPYSPFPISQIFQSSSQTILQSLTPRPPPITRGGERSCQLERDVHPTTMPCPTGYFVYGGCAESGIIGGSPDESAGVTETEIDFLAPSRRGRGFGEEGGVEGEIVLGFAGPQGFVGLERRRSGFSERARRTRA